MIQPVVRAVIKLNEKYLLVKNQSQDFWCLPGGKVDEGEEIIPALERELVEELGVKPKVGRLLYVYQFFRQDKPQRLEFIFLIDNPSNFEQVNLQTDELDAAEFCDLKTVKVLPEFLEDLPQALNFPGKRPVFKVSRSGGAKI